MAEYVVKIEDNKVYFIIGLVRCKDCKFWKLDGNYIDYNNGHYGRPCLKSSWEGHTKMRRDDGFCSLGEKNDL